MTKAVQVRMYNVGFGDCFLIRLPEGQKVLVDAGFHSLGKGAFSGNELVQQIISDVTDHGGNARIDVIIATHRHQDHIYAFNSALWDTVEIGEVWLPWVEDRQNADAVALWKKKTQFALDLAAAAPTFNLTPQERGGVEFMLWNAGVDVPGMAGIAGWSNQGALDRLHEGFSHRDRAKPRYLPSSNKFPQNFKPAVLPGVRAYVLGPPRDPDLIEELDPTADGETYRALALRAAAAGSVAHVDASSAPFSKEWQVSVNEPGFSLELADMEYIESLAQRADALAAAEHLDDMINSTSLVLLLEIGKARLLLPGDAEWGTWKRILDDEDARALLRGATFFKVGHHGSHNATPKTLVEQVLPRNIPAMISTQEGKGGYRRNIPLDELLDALDGHDVFYARSDGESVPSGFDRDNERRWVDLEVPV